jgi:magnesium chelatase accessory protein
MPIAKPDWNQAGRDWPNRASSQFVEAGGLRWHVQVAGAGPVLLLIHGTGAATHSWRDMLPLLARDFTVVAPDLPGHGFTGTPAAAGLSLPGMAAGLQALLGRLAVMPVLAAGHSAGAAILIRMCLDGMIAPAGLVSLNGAVLPLPGMQAQLFYPAAKLIAALPVVPRLFAWRASNPATIRSLLQATGSSIDAAGMAQYALLARSPGHVAGAIGMMANWDLRPVERDLPRLATKLTLVVGARDRTIPPSEAGRIRALLPSAELVTLPRLGHLAHEEQPAMVAALIRERAP